MRHRAGTLHFLPYPAARHYVQTYADVHNRDQYYKWHDSVKPEFLPKRPHRVYENFTWNDFLGNTNSFEKTLRRKKGEKVTWRPFWEAVRYAQRMAKEHNITTQKEWEKWHDSGMCPRDIPKRPQLEYSEFTGAGWKTWLGKTIKGKIMTQKHNVAVFALHTTTYQPKNILTIRKYVDGMMAMNEALQDDTSLERPIRVYKWEDEMGDEVYKILSSVASDQGNSQWLCSNVHELLFELDNTLEWVR